MILADAQRLVTDLTAQGYDAWITQAAAGVWNVQTRAPAAVDRPTVNAFAAQHNAAVQSYGITTQVTFA